MSTETFNWSEHIRDADAPDASFVVKSWLDSFRGSAWAGSMDNDDFDKVYTRVIHKLIARGARVKVVANPAAPTQVVGWLCYENDAAGKVVIHYMFTKRYYREKGVMKALLKHARVPELEDVFYSFKTPVINKVLKNGKYRPEIARNKSVGRQRTASHMRAVAQASAPC